MTTNTPAVDEAVLNLLFLRDVVIPYMREHLNEVEFDYFYLGPSPGDADERKVAGLECGTYRCLGGWYLALRDPQMRHADLNRAYDDIFGTLQREFAISTNDLDPLFGPCKLRCSKGEDLEERAEILDRIIAERRVDEDSD